MRWLLILTAWICKVWADSLGKLKTSEIQYDEGVINSLRSGNPLLGSHHAETVMEFEDDYSIQEGDILLPSDRNAVSELWPEVDGRMSVPFEIDIDIEERTEDILKALNMISEKTCIQFHTHANETDYLHFYYSYGCASYVGCVGGEQPVLVGHLCQVGNICHEVLHSLGLHHEHSRRDRGSHITIVYDNIVSGKEDNFITKEGNTLGLPYDLGSILHYGSNYFSRNGKPTIVPKESGTKIGQRTQMSDLDVLRIRRLYQCDRRENRMAS